MSRNTHATIPITREVVAAVADRFWPYVIEGAPDECWEWQGRRSQLGYGLVTGRNLLAHRVALTAGSWAENNADVARKGRSRRAKVSNDEVISIRAERAAGALLSTLAARYGVSEGCISGICLGRQRRHVGAAA